MEMQRSYHFDLAERTRLSPAERERLVAMAPARRFADGQFVQQQGDPGGVNHHPGVQSAGLVKLAVVYLDAADAIAPAQ